jgi:hypothetical protein
MLFNYKKDDENLNSKHPSTALRVNVTLSVVEGCYYKLTLIYDFRTI